MSWNGWSAFAAMGGYGLYVWGSLGLALGIVVVEPLVLRVRHRALCRDLAAPEAHEEYRA